MKMDTVKEELIEIINKLDTKSLLKLKNNMGLIVDMSKLDQLQEEERKENIRISRERERETVEERIKRLSDDYIELRRTFLKIVGDFPSWLSQLKHYAEYGGVFNLTCYIETVVFKDIRNNLSLVLIEDVITKEILKSNYVDLWKRLRGPYTYYVTEKGRFEKPEDVFYASKVDSLDYKTGRTLTILDHLASRP